MIARRIGRPAYGTDPLGLEPFFSFFKQSMCYLLVIDSVKKTKEAYVFLLILIISVIHQRAQAAC